MGTMILLVGEQPAPNLLPLRHYDPECVALVHTALTAPRAKRLADVIGSRVQRPLCQTDPYRVADIRASLDRYIQECGWSGGELIFNLTGGTKPMMLTAYEVARQRSSVAFYYQTEDNQSLIHPYRFENGRTIAEAPVPVRETLTLHDYLRLYVGDYRLSTRPKDPFEVMTYQALAGAQWSELEVMPAVFLTGLGRNVEVDMLARCGNQVAVFEVKRAADKRGIDQLNSVTDQRTLGTYARKVLISATPLDENNRELAKAYRIHVLVLESGRGSSLSADDTATLIGTVREVLEPKR